MNASEIEVVMIDPKAVKVFVHRTRDQEKKEEIKEAMKSGVAFIPIQVRDIRKEWSLDERRRPDGGLYDYELIVGEGRLENALELKWPKIPATFPKSGQAETIGRFLVENMVRKPLPWAETAKLVKEELDAGRTPKEVAGLFRISEAHVAKCQRILSKSAIGLGEEIAAMAMNEAEVLTTLPPDEQKIVVEVLKETAGAEGNVQAAVAKAKAVKAETGTLSPLALKKSLQRVDEELADVRDRLKPVRLHWSLGPCNLKTLLENPKFKSALKKAGVATAKFEALTK